MKSRRRTAGGTPNRTAGKADRPITIWTIRAADAKLHEIYAGLAMNGILAAQGKDPNAAWVRRRSFRIGCGMAEEAVRLRRKQPR